MVNEGSNIAEKDEMVISKLEYSELLDLKLKMSNEIQSVKAKCTSLEQRYYAQVNSSPLLVRGWSPIGRMYV